MVLTQHSPHRGSTQPSPHGFALQLELRSRNVAGAGGLGPPLRGPKPRVLPLDDAPVSNGGPDHAPPHTAPRPPRPPRRWIWRAWSSERATPNTVGPLPDITAPSAPAASSAAFIRPITGMAGSTQRSRWFVSAAATLAAFRVLSASSIRLVPSGFARHPPGTRPHTSCVDSATPGLTGTVAQPPTG